MNLVEQPWLRVRWFAGRVVAYGAEREFESPRKGDLLVVGGDDTHTGEPRRITDVRDDVVRCRAAWIVEHVDPDAPDDHPAGVLGLYKDVGWYKLPEHYPVCRQCQRLMPCPHLAIDAIAESQASDLDDYSTPGVCPACQEPVTSRQKSVVFDCNLHGTGDVVFHLRRKCRAAAETYDMQVHAHDGRHQLTCPGRRMNAPDPSGDRATYCTEEHCRGPRRRHAGGTGWSIAMPDPRTDGYRIVVDQEPRCGGL